jgi:hypothetical protein
MRKILVLFTIFLVLFLAWRIRSKRAEEHREAAYRAALAQFQPSFRLGMSRAEVEKSLDFQKVSYTRRSGDIDVRIGKDPGSLCDATVYVAFQFNYLPGEVGYSPLDNLRSISIERVLEDCL